MFNHNRLVIENHKYMESLITDDEQFYGFLNSMAKYYKTYNLDQQLNLHLHAPQTAKAVATEAVWRQYLGTELIADATPIPILVRNRGVTSVVTVYDVQDTILYNNTLGNDSRFDNIPWSYKAEHESTVTPLFTQYCSNKGLTLDDAIREAVQRQETVLESDYPSLLAGTVEYIIRTRLGLPHEKALLEGMSREGVNLQVMLTEANTVVNTLLAPVRTAINDYERNKANGIEVTKNEREQRNENDRAGDTRVRLREVGGNPENANAGESAEPVAEPTRGGDAPSDATRASGEVELGGSTANAAANESMGRDGGAESAGRPEVDLGDGANQNDGIRDDDGSRLSEAHDEDAPNDTQENQSTSEVQLSTGEAVDVAMASYNTDTADNTSKDTETSATNDGNNDSSVNDSNNSDTDSASATDSESTSESTSNLERDKENGATEVITSSDGDIPSLDAPLPEDNTTTLTTSIRNWYREYYPTDAEMADAMSDISFADMLSEMSDGGDFYELVNAPGSDAVDTIVRERVFSKAAELAGINYDDVYNMWLGRSTENTAEQVEENSAADTSTIDDVEYTEVTDSTTDATTDDTAASEPSVDSEANIDETTSAVTDITNVDIESLDFSADLSSTAGKRAVFQRNVATLNILKDLETADRAPTELEKKVLESYEGWGGMPEAFDENNKFWRNEYALLKGLMSEADYEAARASTLNAHFTPNELIEGIYEGIKEFGFEGGNILDPSTGTGRFIQNLPENIASNSNLYGIELDATTAKIARYLNPNAKIYHQGFETTSFPDNSFDMAITNVPFGNYQVEDKTHKGMLVHDYFVTKMVDQVRPGGLVIAITSTGTMDKKDNRVRLALACKADLITAIRLPNNAFSADGTEAITDILVLQKREKELDAGKAMEENWVNLDTAPYPYYNHEINQYFKEAGLELRVLGKLEEISTAYGRKLTVVPDENNPNTLKERITEALQSYATTKRLLNGDKKIYQPLETPLPPPRMEIDYKNTMPYGYYFEDSKLIKITADGKKITPELSEKETQQVTAAIHIRDNIRELFKAQQNDCSDEVLKQLQANLKLSYDEYTNAYGNLTNARNFKKLFRDDDASYGLLLSLEILNEDTNEITLSKVFTERTIKAYRPPTSADTPEDALMISIQEKGKVDLQYMAQLTKTEPAELVRALEFSSIYEDIPNNAYVTADEYLSGNIRAKIEKVEAFISRWEKEQESIAYYDLYPPKAALLEVVLNEADITDAEKQTLPQSDFQREFLEQKKYDSEVMSLTSDDIQELIKSENTALLIKMLNEAPEFTIKVQLKTYSDLIPKFKNNSDFYINLMQNGVSKYELNLLDKDVKTLLTLKRQLKYRLGLSSLDELTEAHYSLLRECVDVVREHPEMADTNSALDHLVEEKCREQEHKVREYIKNSNDELIQKLQGEIDNAMKNIKALETVKPKDLTAEEIKINLGATWIPVRYIQDFLRENFRIVSYRNSDVTVEYCTETGEWNISNKKAAIDNPIVQSYGVPNKSGLDIIEATLNLRTPTVYKTVIINDEEKRVLDKDQTMLAAQKQADIKKAFTKWIYNNPERKNYLVNYYNRNFNNFVPRQFDGSKLTFPGINPTITLKPHQKDAVARTLFGGNTLLAHVVGAGKTFEMQASAMEAKRIGLAKKSVMIMPKHLTEQFGAEFLRLYPDAKVLVTTKDDFRKSSRQEFISKITNQDWDAIVMSYEQFEKIPLSPQRQLKFINDEITKTITYLRSERNKNAKSFSVKAAQRKYKQLKAKFDKLQTALNSRADDTIYFEDLGIDRLYVDESHNYKNLEFDTKIQGIPNQHVEKTFDMLGKINYLNEITGERGVVFASGTPVSNSLAELYTLQRYLRPSKLKEAGIEHFDAWAATFGESVTNMEISPDGRTFQPKTRFAKFQNIPELIAMFKDFADVQTADMLKLPVPTHDIVVEKLASTPVQSMLMNDLSERADLIRQRNPRILINKDGKEYEDIMLNITTDGRKLAMDARLLDAEAPDEHAGKIERCVNNVVQIYNDTAAEKSTQIIFSDIGTPAKDGRFTVYKELHDKLVANGVKEDEIAIIHDYEDEKKKLALFDKVNKGKVRILLGSSEKLGVGTNVQKKLIATHDLDCPWKPSQLEQRLGRIVRRGNENEHVKIYRYVTENSFDSYLWQTCENKQRFISQVMTSKSPVRVAEDVDETTLSYADIKAICTGNPLFKEKMELERDLEVLKSAKSQYLSLHEKLGNHINKTLPAAIHRKENNLEYIREDIKTVSANNTPDEVTFCGKQYSGDKEIGAMLTAVAKEFREHKLDISKISGTYRGLKLAVIEDFMTHITNIKLGEHANYIFPIGTTTPEANANRLKHTLEALKSQESDCLKEIDKLNKQLELDKAEYAKPFDKADELATTEKRLTEVTIEIQASSDESIKNEINNRLNTIVGLNEIDESDTVVNAYIKIANTLLTQNANEWSSDFDSEIYETMMKSPILKPQVDKITTTIMEYSPSLPSKEMVESIIASHQDITIDVAR